MAILMTGVTGVLGAVVARELGKDGKRIFFLVREGSKSKLPEEIIRNHEIIIGDITLPMCGLSPEEIAKLVDVTKIIHLAADVSFSIVDKDGLIRKTNFDGTKNVLDLANELEVAEFHYCGTAYSSTKRNPYELSKDDAEKLVVNFCTVNNINFSIYKPSAMVGDYDTGVSQSFNGYVGAFAVFHFVAEALRARGAGEIVDLPIYVACSDKSTMNLIPVDWVTETMVKLLRLGAKNEKYYLTHNQPPLARWVIEEGFKNLRITGIKYILEPITPEEKAKLFGGNPNLIRYQKLIDRILDQYQPYCLSEETFPPFSTPVTLWSDFRQPPPITAEFIARLFKYAVSKGFK